MEIVSANALISINATFFVQLISFLLFMLVLNKVMVGPLRKVNAKRNDYINSIQDKIKHNEQQLKIILLEFEKKKTEVVRKSLLETSEMKSRAQAKSSEIYTKARDEIINLRKVSEKEINKHTTELRAALDTNIDGVVEFVTRKILENGRLVK